VNVHMIGERRGFCRGEIYSPCSNDSECGEIGQCRYGGAECNAADPNAPTCEEIEPRGGHNSCDRCLIDTINMFGDF